MTTHQTFQVDRDDYARHRTVVVPAADVPPLAEGAIRVNVERFAFTANNVTYAVAGDMLGYWQFFPVLADDSDGDSAEATAGWMSIDRRSGLDGPDGLAGVYDDVLTGSLPPSSGVVVEL